MTERIEIDVHRGGVLPITVAPTSIDQTILQGGGILSGWSLRDVNSTAPAAVSGSVVAPAAGADIAALTGLAAGTYTVSWSVGLVGAAAAADADNFELYDTAGNILASINPGAAGDYPQVGVEVTIAAGAKIAVKAIAVGTAGVTYTAQIAIITDGEVQTVCELQDGNNVLGEVAFSADKAITEHFGDNGPIVFGKIVLHVISGTVTGTVYIIPSRGSQ